MLLRADCLHFCSLYICISLGLLYISLVCVSPSFHFFLCTN